MFRIKRGDKVKVLCGKDRGKVGIVFKVLKTRKGCLKLFVEGINIVKRHYRKNSKRNMDGGVFNLESAISYSNVAVLNSNTGAIDKLCSMIVLNERVRVYKSTKQRF